MGLAIRKERCPRCAEKGNDTRGDNLVIFGENDFHCFACGYHSGGSVKSKIDKLYEQKRENAEDLRSLLSLCFAKRGISDKVLKAYSVSFYYNATAQQYEVCFPFYDRALDCYNKKTRAINLTDMSLSRNIRFVKRGNIVNPFFGYPLINKLTKKIIICEGETDALRLATQLSKEQPALEHGEVVVLGLASASFARQAAAICIDQWADKYIYLAFDNDEAGFMAKRRFMEQLGEKKVAVFDFPLPKKYKDVSDFLTAEPGVSVLQLLAEAKPASAVNLLFSEEITSDLLKYINQLRGAERVRISFSPSLDKAIKLTAGKLVGVIGDAGQGKSTFVEQLSLEAMEQGHNVLFISAEMKAAELALRLVRNKTGVNWYDNNLLAQLTPEDIRWLENYTKELTKRLTVFNRFGTCSTKEIERQIVDLIAWGKKPSLVVIDHMLAIANDGSTEELEGIAKNLKAIAERNEVCIVLLCHTRKPESRFSNRVVRPQLQDVYNSGGLARYADVVLGIALDKLNRVTLVETVKKDRMSGGYVDIQISLDRWSLVELNPPAEDDDKEKLEVNEIELARAQVQNAEIQCKFSGKELFETEPQQPDKEEEPETVAVQASEVIEKQEEQETTEVINSREKQMESHSSSEEKIQQENPSKELPQFCPPEEHIVSATEEWYNLDWASQREEDPRLQTLIMNRKKTKEELALQQEQLRGNVPGVYYPQTAEEAWLALTEGRYTVEELLGPDGYKEWLKELEQIGEAIDQRFAQYDQLRKQGRALDK